MKRAGILVAPAMLMAMLLMHGDDALAENRSAIIQFRAFSLSPGQKVSGITIKTSDGRTQVGSMPGRWRCQRDDRSIRCFSLHPQYAIAMTGRLPEIIVTDLSGRLQDLKVEASIDYLDDNGRESSREISASDLIIK